MSRSRCDCNDKPGCLGVVIIALVVLWLTGNCDGPKAPPTAATAQKKE